jgi:hypothetical protein
MLVIVVNYSTETIVEPKGMCIADGLWNPGFVDSVN